MLFNCNDHPLNCWLCISKWLSTPWSISARYSLFNQIPVILIAVLHSIVEPYCTSKSTALENAQRGKLRTAQPIKHIDYYLYQLAAFTKSYVHTSHFAHYHNFRCARSKPLVQPVLLKGRTVARMTSWNSVNSWRCSALFQATINKVKSY